MCVVIKKKLINVNTYSKNKIFDINFNILKSLSSELRRNKNSIWRNHILATISSFIDKFSLHIKLLLRSSKNDFFRVSYSSIFYWKLGKDRSILSVQNFISRKNKIIIIIKPLGPDPTIRIKNII